MALRVKVRQADTTPDAYLKCRNWRHAWDEFAPIDLDPPLYGWRCSLRCLRCTTERHDVMDFAGNLMDRRYVYPEGYRYAAEEKPTQQVFRQELFEKLRGDLEKMNAIGAATDDAPIPIERARKRVQKQTRKGA